MIANFFKKLFKIIKKKFKDFFALPNLKHHAIGFSIALGLLIIDLIVAYKLGYQTSHKRLYDAGPYAKLLIVVFLLYLFRLFVTNKKSSSDLVIVVYLFLLFWDVAYKVGWVHNDLLIPSPEGLFYVFKQDKSYLREMVWDSLQLLFWGFFLAIVSGTIIGLIVGWFARVRDVVLPISNAITLIPPVLMTSWLIIWFPFKQAAVAIIFLAVFWPTLQGMIQRVGSIDKKVIDAARVMGVTNFGMLGKVIFPYCLPGIIISVSKSLRGAFMCLAGAEMIGINGGIGFYTETFKAYADYRRVLAGIVTIGFMTTIIDILVHQVEKSVVKWRV